MKGIHIFLIGTLIWFIGTWHGGFSSELQSSFEKTTDFVGVIMIYWGIIKDVLGGVTYSKVNNITTEKVEIVSNQTIHEN